jgi:hypothetical protein
VQRAESAIRRELSQSCSCQKHGTSGCAPCDLVPELLNSLDTTSVYGADKKRGLWSGWSPRSLHATDSAGIRGRVHLYCFNYLS